MQTGLQVWEVLVTDWAGEGGRSAYKLLRGNFWGKVGTPLP